MEAARPTLLIPWMLCEVVLTHRKGSLQVLRRERACRFIAQVLSGLASPRIEGRHAASVPVPARKMRHWKATYLRAPKGPVIHALPTPQVQRRSDLRIVRRPSRHRTVIEKQNQYVLYSFFSLKSCLLLPQMDCLVTDQSLESLSARRKGVARSGSRGVSSLPHDVGRKSDGFWRDKFIPTVIAICGASAEVWKFDVEDMVPILQRIWDAIYPSRKHQILNSTRDSVFYQVFFFFLCRRSSLKCICSRASSSTITETA